MASISSLSGTSSASSIYGSRNVISGLASGMDTESMIENAVSGIKTRISSLQQKRTKVEWQQEAYRSIITKMVGFNSKYTSFNSQTNLLSNSFFNNAVTTTAHGANASKVSATGKTSSDVAINGVRQLATAARYTVSGGRLGGSSGVPTATAGDAIKLNENMDVSTIAGTMTLTYGNKSVYLDFGELETFEDADAMVKAINEKLADQKITLSSGEQKKASDLIRVTTAADGTISFSDKSSGGNSVYISGASANIKDVLNIKTGSDEKQSSFKVSNFDDLITKKKTSEYLADKTMSITVDGVNKSIAMPTQAELAAYVDENPGDSTEKAYVALLQKNVDKAFGSGKLTVSNAATATGELQLQFTGQQGSTFSVSSKVGEALGFEDGLTSYINTSKKLGDLVDLDRLTSPHYEGSEPWQDARKSEEIDDGKGNKKTRYYYENDEGKKVYTDKDGNHVDANDKKLYSFKINGVEVGQFTEDTALESVMTAINGNTEAGVKVSYSKITNEFVFSAKETGAGGKIEFGEGLADEMFGVKGVSVDDGNGSTTVYEAKKNADGKLVDNAGNVLKAQDGTDATDISQLKDEDKSKVVADTDKKLSSAAVGQDAIFTATINGTEIEMHRSSNIVDFDGLSVTFNETFGYKKDDATGNEVLDTTAEKVTFTSKADADKIVEAVKNMVNDFNEMISEIKKAYSTMPAEKSATKHTRYEPLTEEDKAEMSESAIEAYEEKAKQGILFADSDLSSLYSKLRTAISPSGTDGAYLRGIGLGTEYSDGLTTINFDEKKFRAALESDPDKVRDAFTKTKESGSSTNGLMQSLKSTLDNYATPTGASKGILIQKAGSPLAPTSILENSLKSMMDNYDKQIDKWQDKLADKVDYYTSKFTQLEKLIAEMNSQSSALMGMMGTGS